MSENETHNALAHLGLDLAYADSAILVLNKPSGLLSVPGRGDEKHDSLATRVQSLIPEALIVHRLDMETSGLIVMARGKAAQRALSIAFQERQIRKRYIAVVDGALSPTEGEVNLPLSADWPRRPRQKIDTVSGKPSRTHYRLLAASADNSRLELIPETGRSHQLRVHMAALGHPILGDPLYALPAIREKAPRLLLHAENLAFQHPFSQQWLEISAPAPF